MSEQLPDALVQKRAMVKIARSIIRLKYSIMADEELNRALPALEQAFDLALQKGQLAGGEVDVAALVKKVLK